MRSRSSAPSLVLVGLLATVFRWWDLAAAEDVTEGAVPTSSPFTVNTTLQPTAEPTPFTPPESGCYTDLNKLANRVANKPPFKLETFVLCPHTVFPIGFFSDDGKFQGGFPALELRQNTHYLCGEDGKSSNNCTIEGGQFQVLSTVMSFNEEPKVNILLKGITFRDGGAAGALLVAPGHVTFEDCIFRVGLHVYVCPRLSCFFPCPSNYLFLFFNEPIRNTPPRVPPLCFSWTARIAASFVKWMKWRS